MKAAVSSPCLTRGMPYASLGLLLAAAAFSVFALFEFVLIPFHIFRDPQGPLSVRAPEAAPRSLANFDQLQRDFSAHALFYRPQAAAVAAGPGLDDMLKPFQLIGIIQGENPEALIKNQATQQTLFARKGEKFEQFTVSEIGRQSITVSLEGQSREMMLEEGAS